MSKEKNGEMGGTNITLYSLTLDPVSKGIRQVCQEQEVIPANVLMDIYTKVVENGSYKDVLTIKEEACQLQVFLKLMKVKTLRDRLHKFFKVATTYDLMNDSWLVKIVVNRELKEVVYTELLGNDSNENDVSNSYRQLVLDLLPSRLAANFENKAMKEISSQGHRDNLIKIGMELGEFLCEAGWHEEGAKVLNQCMYICLAENKLEGYKQSIRCLERLLSAQVYYSLHSQARMTYETANMVLKKLLDAEVDVNLAGMYSAFSSLCYLECNYNDSLEWSIKALEALKENLHYTEPKTTVDILRQAARSCVVKREFHKAELLIKEAVYLARDVFGSKSVKYADALIDYGYYLVNRDSVHQSVTVYRECLQIRKAAFGRYNLMTAIVIEDLAYALYVMEYSTGNFSEARCLAQKAISVMTVLLQPNHLQFASVKRVKALILEEIAIDSHGAPLERELLNEAEELHLHALKLSQQVFGEINVQIAKHYGNLGRLYQSMKKYSDAESMHLKAISIKETLLGVYDYEVALSAGHLASLYNYDMEQYRKAEALHLRSINIGKRLFGDAYSGLEYDYRGLLQIYNIESNHDKFEEYSRIFTQWKMLRDLKAANGADRAISESQLSKSVSSVIKDFFTMKWINVDK